MTKKEYILYILESLEEIWDKASGLKNIFENINESNDELFDKYFQIFKDAIKKVKDKKTLDVFNKSSNILKQLKNVEFKESNIKDKEELLKLEKQLENII